MCSELGTWVFNLVVLQDRAASFAMVRLSPTEAELDMTPDLLLCNIVAFDTQVRTSTPVECGVAL